MNLYIIVFLCSFLLSIPFSLLLILVFFSKDKSIQKIPKGHVIISEEILLRLWSCVPTTTKISLRNQVESEKLNFDQS